MPKYHFELRTGDKVTNDEEGCDLPDGQAARRFALGAARELLAEAIRWGVAVPPDRIVIVDNEGTISKQC